MADFNCDDLRCSPCIIFGQGKILLIKLLLNSCVLPHTMDNIEWGEVVSFTINYNEQLRPKMLQLELFSSNGIQHRKVFERRTSERTPFQINDRAIQWKLKIRNFAGFFLVLRAHHKLKQEKWCRAEWIQPSAGLDFLCASSNSSTWHKYRLLAMCAIRVWLAFICRSFTPLVITHGTMRRICVCTYVCVCGNFKRKQRSCRVNKNVCNVPTAINLIWLMDMEWENYVSSLPWIRLKSCRNSLAAWDSPPDASRRVWRRAQIRRARNNMCKVKLICHFHTLNEMNCCALDDTLAI